MTISRKRTRWCLWPSVAACIILMGVMMIGCEGVSATRPVSATVVEEWQGVSEYVPKLFPARQGDKWGFVDSAGRVVIPYQYDDAHDFSDGMAGVKVGDLWGYIDDAGALAIAPRFIAAPPFQCGLAQVFHAEAAYIDKSGQPVIDRDPRWVQGKAMEFSEGLAAVMLQEGGYGYLDVHGELVLTLHNATAAGRFSEGLASMRTSEGYGYIDRQGVFVIKPQFHGGATAFSDGVAVVEYDIHKYAIIDRSGCLLRELPFDQVAALSQGRAAMLEEGAFAALSADVASRNRTYLLGYMDDKGELVIAPRFRDAAAFRGGLARVEDDDGKMAYIDLDGNYIWRED